MAKSKNPDLPAINNKPEEAEKLLKWLKTRFDESKEAAVKWHKKFNALYDLFEGKVDDYYQRGDDEQKEGEKHVFRSMAISQFVRAAVGIIDGTQLRPYVVSESQEYPGLDKLGTSFLKTWFENPTIRDEFDEMMVDYCLCGTALACNPWNPFLDKYGDVDLWRVPLVNTFPEPGGKSFQKMNICQFTKLVDEMEIREKYGESIETSLENAAGSGTDTEEGERNQSSLKPRKYRLYMAYYRDEGKWNNVVYSNKIILEHKGKGSDNSFPYENMPYYSAKFCPIPGEFWGKGIGEDIESIERIIDKMFQQVIANQQDVGSTLTFVNISGLEKDFELSDIPGQVIKTAGNRRPDDLIHQKGAVSILGDAGALTGILNARMVDITGIHAPAVGKRAQSVESGEAIRALQSGTNQTFAPSLMRWIRFIRKISENSLGLMFKNYSGGRRYSERDEAGMKVLKKLANDFPENFRPVFDIDIQDDSKLPSDPVGRAEMAMKGIEIGAVDQKYWREQMGINDPQLEQRVDMLQKMQQAMAQMQQTTQQLEQRTQQAEAQVKNLETQLQRSAMANSESRVREMISKAESRNERSQAEMKKERLQTEKALGDIKVTMKQIQANIGVAKANMQGMADKTMAKIMVGKNMQTPGVM